MFLAVLLKYVPTTGKKILRKMTARSESPVEMNLVKVRKAKHSRFFFYQSHREREMGMSTAVKTVGCHAGPNEKAMKKHRQMSLVTSSLLLVPLWEDKTAQLRAYQPSECSIFSWLGQ